MYRRRQVIVGNEVERHIWGQKFMTGLKSLCVQRMSLRNSVKEKIWAVSVFVRQIQTRALARVESDARIRVCELFLWLKQQKPIQIFRAFSVTNKRCPILPMSLFNACLLSKYSVHYAWFIQAYAEIRQWKPTMQIATCLSVLWLRTCGHS